MKVSLYDSIVEKIQNDGISYENLISNIKNNCSFNHQDDQQKIELTIENKSDFDGRLNNDFISYFLSLLHEEGNKYLSILNKTTHATPATTVTPILQKPPTPLANTTNRLDIHNHSQHALFATPKSNTTTKPPRKISLQPLINSPSQANLSFTNAEYSTHQPQYHNSNSNSGGHHRYRRNNSFTSPNTYSSDNIIMNNSNNFSSPMVHYNNSPKFMSNNSYSAKTASKPTLFDYISTPIKSPKQNSSNIIEPTLQVLPEGVISPTIDKISTKFSLLNTGIPEVKLNEPSNELIKNKNVKELGVLVKNALNETEMKKLGNIAKVYSELLINNLVFSLNTEMFFLFQLLTLNSLDENSCKNESNKKMKIFGSIESCIYFSINALCNLECILKFLKSPTILELQQNIYVKTFSYLFKENSEILNHSISTEELKSKSRLVFFELKQVPFYADIHVRENFPTCSDTLFVAFKSQRDTFYDILTDWEKNHKLENWNFAEAHGYKIKELVSHEFYGTNCLCFVKLFQEQFILMCKHDKLLIDKKDDEINGPDHIKAAYDPLKLKRLNVRMSTPDPNYGPNPAPKFTGYQEFFKDFIDISSNPTFVQLLKDSLNLEIQKIHDEIPNVEDGNENSINKDIIEDLILRSRIIGKFLGYLVFLPYQSVFIPNYLVKDVNTTRNLYFQTNIKTYLERAILNRHLILTVPFIVEFLSMCDENAISIEIVKETFSLLINIFRSHAMHINSSTFTIDKLFILFSIAWLLQLKIVSKNLLQVNEITNLKMNKTGLDNLNLITPFLLHYCCPYLDELHKLLIRFSYGIKRSLQQINNVSNLFGFELLKEPQKQSLSTKQIQDNLETQFFHIHPHHKRVVEFISEKIVSNFVRYYKHSTFKTELNEYKENFIIEYGDDNNPEEIDKLVRKFSVKCSTEFGKKCIEQAKEYCKPKISSMVSLIISEFTHQEVINITNYLTIKMTIEKLKQWIKVHLAEDIFYDEFKNKEFKKRLFDKSFNASLVNNTANNTDLEQTKLFNNTSMNNSMNTSLMNFNVKDTTERILTSQMFNEIKIAMKTLWNSANVESSFIGKLLHRIFKLIQTSSFTLQSFLAQLASEIVILFISTQNTELDDEILENYYQIEAHVNSSNLEVVFSKLVCKRNICLVKNSKNQILSLRNYKNLINNFEKKFSFKKIHESPYYDEIFSINTVN